MKIVKLYSIITYYILASAAIYQLEEIETVDKHLPFWIIIAILELIYFITLIKRLIIDNNLSYSSMLRQLSIIVISMFIFEYSGIYFYIMIVSTILLFYLLNVIHQKEFTSTRMNAYNNLKIRNNILLSVIYIGYGVLCYGLYILNNPQYITLVKEPMNLIYYAFYPYVIIILGLFNLSYDVNTDKYNTDRRYKDRNKRSIIKRNIGINLISMVLFLI